jgi:cytoskeletal protein CcmA (bactofilin family)
MWKKDDDVEPEPVRPIQKPSIPERRASVQQTAERATVGPSIAIRGDISGDEDLLILGKVEGTVDLKEQSVTIGPSGHVKADVIGHTVTVEGEVEGNLRGEEQIVLRSSARVEGNIAAPRVTLEDGAVFKGSIDMGAKAQSASQGKPPGETPANRPGSPPQRPADTPATGTDASSKKAGEAEPTEK